MANYGHGQAFANQEQAGYSAYPTSYGANVFVDSGLGAFAYVPNLAPVGTKTAGTYNPGNCDQDADALSYLGFDAGTPGGGDGQAADMANSAGAWNAQFQSAVKAFQVSAQITADGWIGPQTRSAIAIAVNKKNLGQVAPGPNNVVPITPTTPVTPVTPAAEDNTLLYAGLGVAAVVVGGAAWLLLRKKKGR